MPQEKNDAHTFFEKKKELAFAQDDKSFHWNMVLEYAIAGAKLGLALGAIAGSLAGTVAGGIIGWGIGGGFGLFIGLNAGVAAGILGGLIAGAILGFAIMGIIGIAMEGYRCYLANNAEDKEAADSSPTLS